MQARPYVGISFYCTIYEYSRSLKVQPHNPHFNPQVWELPRELGAKPGEKALVEGGLYM